MWPKRGCERGNARVVDLDLAYTPAVELARLIRAKAVSPVERFHADNFLRFLETAWDEWVAAHTAVWAEFRKSA